MVIINIHDYANNFLYEEYGISLDIPIKVNSRLKNCHGFYVYNDEKGLRIELSKRLIDYAPDYIIKDVLRHELIHYALHKLGRNFLDEDDDFKSELNKHDTSPSNYYPYIGVKYIIECRKCRSVGETSIKRHIEKNNEYTTGCCDEGYEYIGDAIYDGESRTEIIRRGCVD